MTNRLSAKFYDLPLAALAHAPPKLPLSMPINVYESRPLKAIRDHYHNAFLRGLRIYVTGSSANPGMIESLMSST